MECFQMFSASPLVLNKLLPDAVDTNLLSFSAKTWESTKKRHTKHCQTLRKTSENTISKLSLKSAPNHPFHPLSSAIIQWLVPTADRPECQTCVHSDVKGFRFTELGLDIGCDLGNKMEGRRCIKSLGHERMLSEEFYIFYVVLHRFHNQGIWTNTWTCMSL